MCGLVGYTGCVRERLIQRMNALQGHRGPDGQGSYEDRDDQIALAHVRLSILDLSDAASQPMWSPDGRYVLVYNGEIYNFRELRVELEARGHVFRSTGDTEVLLCGFLEYGRAVFARLNGMFALAIWDRQRKELTLAKDPFGIKPLYYANTRNGGLVFASEIKSILAHPEVPNEPDLVALQQHLAYCHASGDRTAIAAVKRLAPGHFLVWRKGADRFDIHRYWEFTQCDRPMGDRAVAVADLREALGAAVQRQMVADVPVGTFLSGGLDSSLITAFSTRLKPDGLTCFTSGYPPEEGRLDNAAEDLPYSRDLATRLGLPLKEIELRPDVAELWPKLIYHLDEPVADPAAIACYLISRLAAENGAKVLLSGQGADELFLGYPRYVVMHNTGWLGKLPLPLLRTAAALHRFLPGAREGATGTFLRRARRALASAHQPERERFLALCANAPETEVVSVLSADFRAELGERYNDDCLEHMDDAGLSGLSAMRERDLGIYLPNHNLLYTDKMSMAASIEARVPLLDLDLARTVLSYPLDWLIQGRTTKLVLREAAQGVIPDRIIQRRKAGFGAPYRKWLRYDLAELWHELTSEAAVKARGWFDYSALQSARARSQAGREDLYMLQWAVMTIELWARQFIDQNPAQQPATVPTP